MDSDGVYVFAKKADEPKDSQQVEQTQLQPTLIQYLPKKVEYSLI